MQFEKIKTTESNSTFENMHTFQALVIIINKNKKISKINQL